MLARAVMRTQAKAARHESKSEGNDSAVGGEIH
jgi:hypothetical protein